MARDTKEGLARRESPLEMRHTDRELDEAERLLLRMLEKLDDPQMVTIVTQAVSILRAKRQTRATGEDSRRRPAGPGPTTSST